MRLLVWMDAVAESGERRGARKEVDIALVWSILLKDRRGKGQLNLSRETKFSDTNGNRKNYIPCFADHEQDWQPYRLRLLFLSVTTNPYISARVPPRFLQKIGKRSGQELKYKSKNTLSFGVVGAGFKLQ